MQWCQEIAPIAEAGLEAISANICNIKDLEKSYNPIGAKSGAVDENGAFSDPRLDMIVHLIAALPNSLKEEIAQRLAQ